jgi:hypothetical protein
MAMTATLAQSCLNTALQAGSGLSVATWFTNPTAAQQAMAAFAPCSGFLSPYQQVGVLIAHASGSATPINPNGANIASLVLLIAALSSAYNSQVAANSVNYQFDLVNKLASLVS